MKRNQGMWLMILCIAVIGSATTWYTSRYVSEQAQTSETTVAMAEPYLTQTIPRDQAPSLGSVETGTEEMSQEAAADQTALTEENSTEESQVERPIVSVPVLAAPETSTETEKTVEVQTMGVEARQSVENSSNIYEIQLKEIDDQVERLKNQETDSTTYTLKNTAENELKLWDNEMNVVYTAILEKLPQESTESFVSDQQQWMKDRDAQAVEAAKKYAGGTMEGVEYTATLATLTRERAYELASKYDEQLSEN